MDEDHQQPSTPVGSRVSEIDPCPFLLTPDSWDWGNLLDFHIPLEDGEAEEEEDHHHHHHHHHPEHQQKPDSNQQLLFPWETAPPSPQRPPFPPLPSSRQSPLPSTEMKTTLEVPLQTGSGSGNSGTRVRKRDPRLVCENYLSGRIPCACPEMDKKMEEEAAAEGMVGVVGGGTGSADGRKKARVSGGGGIARCQVPQCQVDINELKGYHRRHRICLRCANAKSVVLDGEPKRYCQQCGKFHVLTDFDEGKRSCRRKLERHNKRRRRRPITDQKAMDEKENNSTEIIHVEEDVVHDDEQSKESLNETQTSNGSDSLCLSNKSVDNILVESRGQDSNLNIRMVHSNSKASFAVSSGPRIEKTDNPVPPPLSSLLSENKNAAYSTVCPTGRMSFKLYDWNPADFPRRLRRQIFQWLDSMPVELEGYIRPGCTILTIFISMPHLMWNKLSKDVGHYLHDFVKTPESLFFKRGNVHIHFNNTLFHILQDGTSLLNVKMEVQVPKLHYVHPVLFEAGKPIEIFACGSNLFQPNFRFLISFGGKYLEYELDKVEFGVKGGLSCNAGHQMLRIRIPQTDKEHFGPAFIEVENESGLSNFNTLLFAEKEIYLELQTMQQPQCNLMNPSIISQITNEDGIQSLCEEASMSRQSSSMSELLLDIGWLLKEPQFDDLELFFSIGNAQRLDCLMRYLGQNKSTKTLKKVMSHVETMLNGKLSDDQVAGNQVHSGDAKLFQKCMDDANRFLHKYIPHSPIQEEAAVIIKGGDSIHHTSSIMDEEENVIDYDDVPSSSDRERKPLLGRKSRNLETGQWQLETYKSTTNTRIVIFIMAGVVICFGLCMAVLHPHKATEFTVSVRRCAFGTRN